MFFKNIFQDHQTVSINDLFQDKNTNEIITEFQVISGYFSLSHFLPSFLEAIFFNVHSIIVTVNSSSEILEARCTICNAVLAPLLGTTVFSFLPYLTWVYCYLCSFWLFLIVFFARGKNEIMNIAPKSLGSMTSFCPK